VAPQDVELLRRLWRDWNAHDDVAAIARDYWHPEIEWHMPGDWGVLGVGAEARGRDAVIRQSQEFAQHMGHLQIEVDQVIDAGDVVFASLRYRARGEKSQAAAAIPAYHVTRVEAGRVRQVWVYSSRAEALKAAGLQDRPSALQRFWRRLPQLSHR
jgi:hypothetical protein